MTQYFSISCHNLARKSELMASGNIFLVSPALGQDIPSERSLSGGHSAGQWERGMVKNNSRILL